jgi:hypothetical protein
MTELTPAFCYAHPQRETGLRCIRCARPICASCAQRAAIGYTCKECIQEHQRKFDTAYGTDFAVVFLVSSFLSCCGALLTFLITSVIWGFFIIIFAPFAGTTIANGARYFIKNRRSPMLNYILAAGIIVGAMPVMFYSAWPIIAVTFLGATFVGGNVLTPVFATAPFIWQLVYLALAVPAAYYQFSGLVFRR